QARVGADMQFTTMGFPPGRYSLTASGTGNGWMFKSATLGGRSLDDDPLDLQGTDVSGVTLTFVTQMPGLSGTVRAMTGTGTGGIDAMVILFPADYTTWIERGVSGRRMRNAQASKTGSFQIMNVLPGNYLAVAVPTEVMDELRDPKFF